MNRARSLQIKTNHGILKTPLFMPDATYGTVTALSMKDLEDVGVEAFVTTTLHIEQKIGSDYMSEFGGLHKFFGWNKPILTDSGGFQVFSLIHRNKEKKNNRITSAGCSFVNYDDGSYNFLSPETSQMIQHKLGADICVVLDEPVIEDDSISRIKRSVERTTEWAKRSKKSFLELNNLTENDFNNKRITRPLLVAVIQGGNSMEYRKISAEELANIGFDIYGFGGVPKHNQFSWKEDAPKGFYHDLIAYVASLIPEDKIRYGLGIGSPDDIDFAVNQGWDIFDTVLPTRNARHGYLYVHKGQGDKSYRTFDVLHIKSERYKFSDSPVDEKCNCFTCKNISRAYLRYLLKIGSATGHRYATIHNLHYFMQLVNLARLYC